MSTPRPARPSVAAISIGVESAIYGLAYHAEMEAANGNPDRCAARSKAVDLLTKALAAITSDEHARDFAHSAWDAANRAAYGD